jgi:calcineurin-like phosphoesterase family protein/2'-5' RNA ligase
MSRPIYLIEIRIGGQAKNKIKDIIYDVSKKFGVKGVTKRRPVPHITLFGPFTTRKSKEVISEFKSVSQNYNLVSFRLTGFIGKKRKNVIGIGVEPSEELRSLRFEISQRLKPFVDTAQPWDYDYDHMYHSTIAFKDVDDETFEKILDYLEKNVELTIKQDIFRITLLKRGKILREYDFILRRLLNRKQALSKKIWEKTRDKYFEIKGIYAKKPNLIQRLNAFVTRLQKKNRIFLISDLHLDHTNIIKKSYCNRPFKSKWDMNVNICKNWNNKVEHSDVVYFLGDLAFGRGSHKTSYWVDKLKGKIVFIKGSHDISRGIKFHEKQILEYNGYKFFLIHEPHYAPKNWDGWVIHGHKHNNDMERYPFINGENEPKTINVSCELLDYTPITFDELTLDLDKIKRHDTINSTPEYLD